MNGQPKSEKGWTAIFVSNVTEKGCRGKKKIIENLIVYSLKFDQRKVGAFKINK